MRSASNNNHHPSLAEFPMVVGFPVLWGDEDSFGHVNNLIYLRWAETARVDYLMRIGLWGAKAGEGVGPILARIACDYRQPVVYPGEVLVGTRVAAIGKSSFRMEHRIVSRATGELAAEVDSTVVVFDYTARKSIRVPERIREAIEKMEGRDFEPAAARH